MKRYAITYRYDEDIYSQIIVIASDAAAACKYTRTIVHGEIIGAEICDKVRPGQRAFLAE